VAEDEERRLITLQERFREKVQSLLEDAESFFWGHVYSGPADDGLLLFEWIQRWYRDLRDSYLGEHHHEGADLDEEEDP
jgi:hypothetical protein